MTIMISVLRREKDTEYMMITELLLFSFDIFKANIAIKALSLH